MISAVDIFSGEKLWDVPLGTIAGEPTSSGNAGGPIVTAGGVVFTAAAATDNFLRAFDVKTGKELWKFELRAGGQATPLTYSNILSSPPVATESSVPSKETMLLPSPCPEVLWPSQRTLAAARAFYPKGTTSGHGSSC
jgi:outer membrane protein assembly factor BamB